MFLSLFLIFLSLCFLTLALKISDSLKRNTERLFYLIFVLLGWVSSESIIKDQSDTHAVEPLTVTWGRY